MGHGEPLSTYVDEVIEKRQREIHVFEELTAYISGWHGGIHVTDFSAWSHAPTAIEEAQGICKQLRITSRSSLHVRVDVEKRRIFKTLARPSDRYDRYESDRPRPDEVIMRRHVWDSHEGSMASRSAFADVVLSMPFGVKVSDDPGEHATQLLLAVQPKAGPKWPFFYSGMGLGEIRDSSVERVDLDGPPDDLDRFDRSMERWARLNFRGRLSLEIPHGMKDPDVAKHLKVVDMWPVLDRHLLGGVASKMSIYSGEPKMRFKITYPAAIDGVASIPVLEHQT